MDIKVSDDGAVIITNPKSILRVEDGNGDIIFSVQNKDGVWYFTTFDIGGGQDWSVKDAMMNYEKELVGKRVTFIKNDHMYSQDMAASNGIPEGVAFKIESRLSTNRYKLVGHGYGEEGDLYGNGAIYVSESVLVRAVGI